MGYCQVVIINGMGTSGKSTFCSMCKDYAQGLDYSMPVYVKELSTVDWVKDVATFCGWQGTKTEKDRKFLSDLKLALEAWDNSPVDSVLDTMKQAIGSPSHWIFFVNCREPRNIDQFKTLVKQRFNWPVKTVLVRNPNAKVINSNMADAQVENYVYDCYIQNSGTLDDLKDLAEDFTTQIVSKWDCK